MYIMYVCYVFNGRKQGTWLMHLAIIECRCYHSHALCSLLSMFPTPLSVTTLTSSCTVIPPLDSQLALVSPSLHSPRPLQITTRGYPTTGNQLKTKTVNYSVTYIN